MRVTVKTGIFFALGWMLVKMIFHFSGMGSTALVPLIFINMFLLLSSIAVGLYLHKKKEGFSQGNALSDIKSGMSAGVPYAVLVVGFIYLYYSQINPDFTKPMIEERLEMAREGIQDPEKLKEIRASNESYGVMEPEEIYKDMEKGAKSALSASSITTISLLGMLVLSTVYSLLITVIFRKVLLRGVIRE